jgi:hypothetical protein
MKDTLLEFRLSTSLIETFIDKKVKERLKREILFALSSFFSQTYRVLLISISKQFANSGSGSHYNLRRTWLKFRRQSGQSASRRARLDGSEFHRLQTFRYL